MKFKEKLPSTGKYFLRLKSGDSVKGVFRGEPYDFKQHWVNQRGSVCEGDGCPHCKEGKKPSFRFRLNFVLSENGAMVAKIFEQGWMVYESLRSLHGADYDLEKTVVQITRHGSGQDTTYSVIPLQGAKGQVTEGFEKQLGAVALHNLISPTEDAAGDFAESDDGVPF